MGIPNLLSLVSTFVRPVHTRYDASGSSAPNAIIDGPALAYYLHRQVVNAHQDAGVNFPYTTYQATAIKWLNELERCGIHVQHILVDGHLPPHKVPIRLGRIQSHIDSLKKLNLQHPPPAPFIIPALLEILAAHPRYGSLTTTVPGEADAFCAALARECEGATIIFTADSDLLLYSVDASASIAMLSTVSFENNGVVVGLYSPHEIRQKLFADNDCTTVDFAFQVLQDQHQSIPSLVKRAQHARSLPRTTEFRAFQAEYDLPAFPLQVPAELRYLDSRLAELVYQSPTYRRLCFPRHTQTATDGEVRIYLPLLLEDPSRSSAWVASQSTRLQAYCLLFPSNIIVTEIYRKGARVGFVPLTTTPANTTLDPQHDLTSIITSIAEFYLRKGSPLSRTQLLAFAAAISPDVQPKKSKRSKTKPSGWTYDSIHLYATLQAGLYSLHLLTRISEITGNHTAVKSGSGSLVGMMDGKRFIDVYAKGVAQIQGNWGKEMLTSVERMKEQVRREEEDDVEEEKEEAAEERWMGMSIG